MPRKPVRAAAAPRRAASAKPRVYAVTTATERPEPDATLPGKFKRLLAKFDLKGLARGAWVPIKMHVGGGLGYTTIHPLFVRTLAQAVKDAGGKPFVVDGYLDAVATLPATAAYNGTEGIEKAVTEQPDMVIARSALSEKHNLVKTLRFEKNLEKIFFLLFE